MQQNKTGPLSYVTHKNWLKTDTRFACKMLNHKTHRRNHKQ